MWYVLNVIQCGAKLIAVYQICTPPDRSVRGCEKMKQGSAYSRINRRDERTHTSSEF